MKKYQFVHHINNNKARRELSKISYRQVYSDAKVYGNAIYSCII